jgi:predicted signal transduction protein with EAL and GGDEF domain
MPLTLSIGLTEAVADDDAVTLIARADKALYQAKSDGRNCRRVVTADAVPDNLDEAQAALGVMMIPPVGSSLAQR